MAIRSAHPIIQAFFRGLGIILPFALTIFMLVWIWNLLAETVVYRVDDAVRFLVEYLVNDGSMSSSEVRARSEEVLPPALRLGVAIVAVAALLLVLGWWLSGFVGRRMYRAFESLTKRIPVFGAIYPHVKQITEFFFSEDESKKLEFDAVVAIPYPREGSYSLAMLTGSSLQSMNQGTGEELVSVFVPSSPMPATGYTIFVPARDIIPVGLSVDEALRIVVSAGVLVPPHESVTPPLPDAHPSTPPDSQEQK
ncbi:MAG: DUF502 domain-containing protein [Planctomycetota bacterium]|nr:MAG: DUF502 domain-containing protein [Planctomycetota bacterium]